MGGTASRLRIASVAAAVGAAALACSQTGCANWMEGVGLTTAAVGGTTVLAGAGIPTTRSCNEARYPCFVDGMPVHHDVTTYHEREVPLMVAGAVIVAAGLALAAVGYAERPPRPAHVHAASPAAPRASAPGSDPESTLLR